MNARDNIRPKSIRLAILTALASGAITTIDDLLIAVEETRAKVTNNAQAAYHDGLIKRMRDDVTGLAAYQITAAGKKYLEKFGDGSKAEPAPEPAVKESLTVAPETKNAEAVAVKALEKANEPTISEVLTQKDVQIASLTRRAREADAHIRAVLEWETAMMKAVGEDGIGSAVEAIEKIKTELADAKASLELTRMARAVVHQGYVIQRPAKPLVRVTKSERAKERALAFARGGKRAQVFALVAVGTAMPGAEWRE